MTPEDDRAATAIAAATDAAERALCAASELSTIAGKMMNSGNTSSSTVTLSGTGVLGAGMIVVGVIACVIAVAGLMVAQYRLDAQEKELAKLRERIELHDVYINTSFRKKE